MSEHTPGPWVTNGASVTAGSIKIRQSCGPSAASCEVQRRLTVELLANAQLIARAPELLEQVQHQAARIAELERDNAELKRSEFICKQCGLRKDSETGKAEF